MASDWGAPNLPRPPSSTGSFWSEPATAGWCVRGASLPPDAPDAADFFGLARKRVRAAVLLAQVAEEEREAAAARLTVSGADGNAMGGGKSAPARPCAPTTRLPPPATHGIGLALLRAAD